MTWGMLGIVMSALIFYEPSGWSLSLAAGMLPALLTIYLFYLLHFPSQKVCLRRIFLHQMFHFNYEKPIIVGRVKNRPEKIDTRNESYVYTGDN